MINFPRACFAAVAILLRQHVGGRLVGFFALLHVLSAIILVAAACLFLRGFASGTRLGAFIDVPIVVPMLGLAFVVAVIWLGRAIGLLHYGGPMVLDGPGDGFTGHAGSFWHRWSSLQREWTILERLEPAMLSVAAVVLIVLPWTRLPGLFLLCMAIAGVRQTTRDRRLNERYPQTGQDFVEPVEADEPDGDVADAFASLDDTSDLLDDGAAETVSDDVDPALPPVATRKPRQRPTFEQRGPHSVSRPPRLTPVFMAVILLTTLNFAIGDPARLYGLAPDRWVAAVDSLQAGGVAVGLFQPADRSSPGELTDAFLDNVDSEALETWKDKSAGEVIAPARQGVAEAAAALERVRLAVTEQLGLPLSTDAHSELLDGLLITRPSVAEAWAAILNGVAALDEDIAEAQDRLTAAERSPAAAPLGEIDQIRTQAIDWQGQADGLHIHIDHIRVMMDALRAEKALNRPPTAEGG